MKEVDIVALIYPMQNAVFVKPQFVRSGLGARAQSLAELRHQRLQAFHHAPHIRPRLLGIIDREAPHRLAFHKVAAQGGALAAGSFRQEWIATGKLRHGREEAAFVLR
jgi:hypothetical protein